jgi:hypothetical protein
MLIKGTIDTRHDEDASNKTLDSESLQKEHLHGAV